MVKKLEVPPIVYDEVALRANDMWALLLSTVRYSLGRRTVMSEEAGNLVLRYQHFLERWQLAQILKEVQEELAREKTHKGWLGMKCDVSAWEKFAKRLEAILAESKEMCH